MNIELQNFVFDNPGRLELINYQPKTSIPAIKINVYRNHSFELVEHSIRPFLDYAGVCAEFIYSDYDDTLSFFDMDMSADLLILWLDANRYKNIDFTAFLKGRLMALKEQFHKPVLVVLLDGELDIQDNQIVVYSLEKFRDALGSRFYDYRLEQFSGTVMSSALSLQVSRDLGLNYIPALIRPCLKAIVVDLDNTLYLGVLGEDGIHNITLTEGHRLLQEKLKGLAEQGFFLCIASKNEESDVLEMFRERADFPLQLNNFTKICCSWNPKAESISQISQYLNIGSDSILFIDDNPGELYSVANVHTDIHGLLAASDALKTRYMLENYPGILKLNCSAEDSIRSEDVQANELRNQIKATLSSEDYIKSLDMELVFHIDDPAQIDRISELSNKTNQFIFNYKRYSPADIEYLMRIDDSVVITVQLSDKLSESGLIAVCTGKKIDDYLEIQECFVSCRALGRGIDEVIVLGMISYMQEALDVTNIKVQFQKGERNVPAEKFVAKYLYTYLEQPSGFSYNVPNELLAVRLERYGL
ncbi:MAG: HAD-IIIC family phosphatase [Enterocloster aldenensis]|uniref:HAD-IIIC family phosphatase n=1 Tax=Enterocloster aldenensis TaxID=358742 RepID=UPI003565D1C7